MQTIIASALSWGGVHIFAKQRSSKAKFAEEMKKKDRCETDDSPKKVVLGNSKTLIFTFKMSKSLRGHNAKQVLKTSKSCFYHGCLEVGNHVVKSVNYNINVIQWQQKAMQYNII